MKKTGLSLVLVLSCDQDGSGKVPRMGWGSVLPMQSTPACFKERKVVSVTNDPSLGVGSQPAASSALLSGHQQVGNSFAITGVLSDCTGGMHSGFGSSSEPPELHREDGQEDARQGAGSTRRGLSATNPSQSFLSLLRSILL